MYAIITGFVNTGNTAVAADRITMDTAHGGLGLFDITEYITGLQCSWIKSAHVRHHDNWSASIAKITHGNPLIFLRKTGKQSGDTTPAQHSSQLAQHDGQIYQYR